MSSAPRRTLLLLCVTALTVAPVRAQLTREEVVAKLAAGAVAGMDFSGAAAPGLTVVNRDLSGTNWRGADLRGVTFSRVNLERAILAGANLRGAVFEEVSLRDADVTGADLSGARLRLVNLSGATLTDVQVHGAAIRDVMLAGNGSTYSDALRLALSRATGQQLTRAWVSGLGGDCFGFVYNTQDPGFWPGQPFTVNPALAAAAILGLDARLRTDYWARRLVVEDEKLAPGVHMLPLRSAQADQWLLRGMPVWAVFEGRKLEDKRTRYAILWPTLGPEVLDRDALLKVWEGPWPTLEPTGAAEVIARHPLLSFVPGGAVPPPANQVRAAFRQAAAIIAEKRTYGPLIPGEAGLARLAGDLRAVAESADMARAQALGLWEQFPRQCLVGSRLEACEFLEAAQAALPAEQQGPLGELLGLYRSEVGLLRDQWQPLAPQGEQLDAAALARYRQAAEVIGTVAASERRAAQILTQAGAQ